MQHTPWSLDIHKRKMNPNVGGHLTETTINSIEQKRFSDAQANLLLGVNKINQEMIVNCKSK